MMSWLVLVIWKWMCDVVSGEKVVVLDGLCFWGIEGVVFGMMKGS